MGLVGFDPIEESDAIELHGLIEEHAERTGSPVAERILREWAAYLPRFVKVMPHDYKRALRELAEAEHEFEPAESTGGEGFVATESSSDGQDRRASSRSRGSSSPSATRRPGRRTSRSSSTRCPSRACASRARAAWSAACRSATTAARWAT